MICEPLSLTADLTAYSDLSSRQTSPSCLPGPTQSPSTTTPSTPATASTPLDTDTTLSPARHTANPPATYTHITSPPAQTATDQVRIRARQHPCLLARRWPEESVVCDEPDNTNILLVTCRQLTTTTDINGPSVDDYAL